MQIKLGFGRYVVAVSGGVDSVVLLDMLAKKTDLELVVAHFDHGIRQDSKKDREFVEKLASKYNVPFEYQEGKLGAKASEAAARKARYQFLEQARKKHRAHAIVTAHHQDDVIETMLINILRGTNHSGLSSMSNTQRILRPLLHLTKADIQNYARQHDLTWREDPSNQDQQYLRNWLRHRVIPKLSKSQKQQLVDIYDRARKTKEEIHAVLHVLGVDEGQLDKQLLAQLPHGAATEYVAEWLRRQNIRDFDKKTIDRIVVGAKTLSTGKQIEIKKDLKLAVGDAQLTLVATPVAHKG